MTLEQNIFKDNLSLEEINIYIDSISEEGLVDDTIGKIKSIFASLSNLFKSFTVEGTAENDTVLQNEIKRISEGLQQLKKYPEQNRIPVLLDTKSKALIGVPNGFKGQLSSYMTLLQGVSSKLQNSTLSEVEKYNATLANIISNDSAKKSHTDLPRKYKIISTEVKKAKDTQHSYFNYSGSNHGMLQLGKLINSYKELLSLSDKSHDLANIIKFKDIMLVSAGISKTTEMLNVIITDVDSNYNTSLIKELAIYTKELANLCEAYSICRYYIELTIVMARNCVVTVTSEI
jgi:hypothetical protein